MQAKIDYKKIKIFVFDLDGTLTKSKMNLDSEMSSLLCKLLEKKKVGIMGGGSYLQFKNQFLKHLKIHKNYFQNLLLFPLSGGSFYKYDNGKWKLIYSHTFSSPEKEKISKAFQKTFETLNYIKPKKIYGKIIENRGSQITFSALGQKAPLEEKEKWHKDNDIRSKIKNILEKYLKNFEIRLGGLTSLDITKKNINKAYGLQQIMKRFSFSKEEIVYTGDALYKGGNDYLAKKAGVKTIKVKDEKETKTLIKSILSNLQPQIKVKP